MFWLLTALEQELDYMENRAEVILLSCKNDKFKGTVLVSLEKVNVCETLSK